jgi:hypothetical protein
MNNRQTDPIIVCISPIAPSKAQSTSRARSVQEPRFVLLCKAQNKAETLD